MFDFLGGLFGGGSDGGSSSSSQSQTQTQVSTQNTNINIDLAQADGSQLLLIGGFGIAAIILLTAIIRR